MSSPSLVYPVIRHSSAGLLALLITFLLFYLMQSLIRTTITLEPTVYHPDILGSVRLEDPPSPPPMDELTPPDYLPPPPFHLTGSEEIIPVTETGPGILPNGPDTGTEWVFDPGERQATAIVTITPDYPARALSMGIEGYAVVEFTVNKDGSTDNIRIIEASPRGIFDKSAINAVSRFKYQPRIVNGRAVAVPGMQIRLTYEFD